MIFSSKIFLFCFLPATLALYYIFFRKRGGNIFLLVASVFFYAWGEKANVIIIAASVIFNYAIAVRIEKYHDEKKGKIESLGTVLFIGAIVVNLGVLFFYKYTGFFINTLTLGAVTISPHHLPVGLSFFTFKALSYIIDVYRRTIKAEKNIIDVGLYISMFPQVVAGPISRYPDLLERMKKRDITFNMFREGLHRFILGLGKKVIIADSIGIVVDQIFALNPGELSTSLSWLGAVGYTLQIYCDFSGYTDMAIGLGRMFGFDFIENFNYPYISKSIREFWKRWHISLSTWFRDYLYIPLGGNRVSETRIYFNLIVVFLLCGLWHGANWTFVVWGLWHGFFLVIERKKIGELIDSMFAPLKYAYAFLIVMLGWVFFRSGSIEFAFGYVTKMFGFKSAGALYYPSMFFDYYFIFALVLGAVFSTPVAPRLKMAVDTFLGRYEGTFACYFFRKSYIVLYEITLVFIFVVCVLQMGGRKDSTFIYSLF